MKCKKCGAENASGRIHCTNCGARLSVSGQAGFNILNIKNEDSGSFDDESISDMERRFTGGLGSWESFTKNENNASYAGRKYPSAESKIQGIEYNNEGNSERSNSQMRTKQASEPDYSSERKHDIFDASLDVAEKSQSNSSGYRNVADTTQENVGTRVSTQSSIKRALSNVDNRAGHGNTREAEHRNEEKLERKNSNSSSKADEALSRRFEVYKNENSGDRHLRSKTVSTKHREVDSYRQKSDGGRNYSSYDNKSGDGRKAYSGSERRVRNIADPRANVQNVNVKNRNSVGHKTMAGRNDEVNRQNASIAKREGLRKRNILSITTAVVALLILILVFVLTLPGTNNNSKYTARIAQSEDRADSYRITVNAGIGDKAVFKTTSGEVRELEITSKRYVTFNVLISDIIPNEPIDTPTYTVEPIVGVIRKGENEVIKVNIDPISVEVPQFAVVFDHETELEQQISGEGQTAEPGANSDHKQHAIDVDTIACGMGAVTISGRLPELDITVTFDDEPVKLEGNTFSYTTKFETAGEHRIQFVAAAPGYLTVRRTFKAIVANDLTAEQVICIADNFNTRVSNETDEITVVGTIPAGAQLRVESTDPQFSLKSDPSVDADGNFSFTVNLPIASKNYNMNIIATTKSGSEIVRPFAVQRPPVFNEYVPTVWACSYDDMIRPMYFGTKGFQIVGYITELISNGDCQRAKMQLATNQTIVINYYNHYAGASTLEANKNYTMYGYPIGLNADGELEVFIWFVRA